MNQQNNNFDQNSYYSYQSSPQGSAPQGNNPPPQQPPESEEVDRYGRNSMVLGIISVALTFFCLGVFVVSPVLAIISLVYSAKAKKASGGKYYGSAGVAGMICSIISLVVYALVILTFIFVIAVAIATGEAIDGIVSTYHY